MKTIKVILLTSCLMIFSLSFAADEIVYQCGFEDSEDLAMWHLQEAENYLTIDLDYQGYKDYFFVGTASAYMGQKSLYVSNDNGVANNMTATQRTNNTGSAADLQITLVPGNYTIDFMYKLPSPQTTSFCITADRFDFDSYNILESLTNTDTWTVKHFVFSIAETTNWISFWYGFNTRSGGETAEGLAIDNIVIRKANSTALTQPQTPTFTLTTQPLQITLSGTDEPVQVHSISGQCVAQGTGAGIYVVPSAGVYIVRVGSEARKVIVK